MADEIEDFEDHLGDGSGEESSAGLPTSDEMNLFHASADLELYNHDEGIENSARLNMERFIAMLRASDKVPEMYQEMDIDDLRHLLQKGLQSRTFVPIVPNAQAGESNRGALSTIPFPEKPKAKRGPYQSMKESMSQTGTNGHHDAFSQTVWKRASRNRREPIAPFEDKFLPISPEVETSLRNVHSSY